MPTALSDRDRRVLDLLSRGYDNDGIEAEIAGYSSKGIVARLCKKFGAKHRAHLLALAYYEGQLPPPDDQHSEIRRISRITLLDAEHNLLLLIACGHSQEEAARALGMAEATFWIHQAAVLRKIGVPPSITHRPRRNYAIAHALWAGILRLDRRFIDPNAPNERQRNLLQHVAAGHNDVQTGAALGMRPTSADNEIGKIQHKWGCQSRADLLRLMLRGGHVTVPAAMWPSVAAMLEWPPSDDETRLLQILARNIGRDQAAVELGIPNRRYRAIYRDLCGRYHANSKAQLTAIRLLTEAVHSSWYLPVGARFLSCAFAPSQLQNQMIAGLAIGKRFSDIVYGGVMPTVVAREAAKNAMMDFFGASTLWHLIAALHSVGQLPAPVEPYERRKIEGSIINPPPAKVQAVLAKLARGQGGDEAMEAVGINSGEFSQGLTAMGAATLTQGVAMFCWVGDSWRGR